MNTFNGKVNVDYLNEAAKVLTPLKQKSYKNMQLKKGDIALDIGCGSGIDVLQMGKIVSPSGFALGVDHDEAMLKEAEHQAMTYGLSDNVKFNFCNASDLPFNDEYFDSCRSERLFVHLSNQQKVLAEIYRVTKPGGRIVIADTDWGSLSIDCRWPHIEQLLRNYRCEKFLTNGYSGRTLYRLFRQYNFSSIEVDIIPMFSNNLQLFYFLTVQEAVEKQALEDNIISQQEIDKWRYDLKQAEINQTFYSSVNIVMITGIKESN